MIMSRWRKFELPPQEAPVMIAEMRKVFFSFFLGDMYLMRGCGKIPIIDGVMTAGGAQLNVLHALSLSHLICCSGKIGNGRIRVCDVGDKCVVRDCHFSCRPYSFSAI
jgi:hypothetical protein